MNLLGYGREHNIELALKYFEHPSMVKDPRALNAIGYINFHAPSTFESDPVLLAAFGSIKQNVKSAYSNFKKAAHHGSVNARYNLGSMYLTGEKFEAPKSDKKEIVEFSFSQAYDHFRQAAEKGHTLAAYNVAIMHFTGLGTYQSCSTAKTFIMHVANVGKHTQGLKEAHKLVSKNRILKATLIYMELAEMGISTAQLNTGLLLDKYGIFDSRSSYLANDVVHDTRQQLPFDINKWLAFNYFKQASENSDTQDEAMLKLGDFYYYGF